MIDRRRPVLAGTAASALLLSACAMTPTMSPASDSQATLPAAVQVPAGHTVALRTVGAGDITYECREKAAMAGQFEWVFVGPEARLSDRQGRVVGRYYGPPATWASMDGSSVTATQLATAPGGEGNIPLQLVKTNPATGPGQMQGLSHIQRVATRGGVAPKISCDMAAKGRREVVQYQADYIFWKPA